MKKYLYIISAVLLLSSCDKRFEENWEKLAVDIKSLSIGASKAKMPYYVYYNGSWSAEITEGSEWFTLENASGTGEGMMHLRCEPNTGLSRKGAFRITADNNQTIDVKVTQGGGIGLPQIVLEKNVFRLTKEAKVLEFIIDTNIPAKYFSGLEPVVTYSEGSEGWVKGFTMLDKEEPLDDPAMPDGVKRFATLTVDENTEGIDRSASVAISMSDADGTAYTCALTIEQNAQGAYVQLPAQDLCVNEPGRRKLPIVTNAEEQLSEATINVTYDNCEPFIENVAIEGTSLCYSVTENNTGATRRGTIALTLGTSTASVTVEQLATGVDFTDFLIDSWSTFDLWASSYDKWKETDKVTLGMDLDFSGKVLASRQFKGSFDGAGHVVRNLGVSSDTASLFSSLGPGAILKNLVLDSSCSFTVTAGTTCYAGVVGKALEGAKIENVTTAATIKAPSAATNFYIGGILGNVAGTGVKVTGCTNSGAITVSGKATKGYVGGITGYDSISTVNIENCNNSGDITVSSALSNGYYGGIIGIMGASTSTANGAALKNCSNTGKIENKGAVTTLYFGGIIGTVSLQKASGGNVENCSNTAEIVNSGNATNLRMAGLIGDFGAGGTVKGCSTECNVTNTGTVKTDGRWSLLVASNTFSSLTISGCEAKGTVSNTASCPKGYMTGILSYTTSTDPISDTKVRAELKCDPVPSTFYKGLIFGGTKAPTLTNCGVAGSVLGTGITADNFTSYVSGTSTSTANCYFLSE